MSGRDKAIIIAIVEDHPIVAEGLQKILAREFSVTEFLQFTSGQEFIRVLKQPGQSIDLTFLDITLPEGSGIELCSEIKKITPGMPVLAFSNHNQRSIIMQMLQQGASGYLLKNASAEELIQCTRGALKGELTFSKEVRDIISMQSGSQWATVPRLTRREKEILRMIADGKTSNEIAAELFVSPLTIETHRRNLMQKFHSKNVAELIKMATEGQFL
ncbi:MAG: response regulator transcription factor [Cyclobacteriaceae bacterium]|nr:response regulator transcription factor [Cyclobacteriaceae bacterium]